MVDKKVLSGLSLGLALSVSSVHAQVEPPQGGTKVAESGVVKIYTLPQDLQTVLEGDDGKYYAINYYTWVDPKESKGSDPIPGVSVGIWWDDPQVSMFFPWGDDDALAEELSGGYEDFATEASLLDGDGNLVLNGYDNGGGFIFGNWDMTKDADPKVPPPEGVNQRPIGSTKGDTGLIYEWNSIEYITRNGSNNRIQAFGGCAVNTISSGEVPGTNDLVTSAVDPCEFDGEKVREDTYAPVFQGGTLVTDPGSADITPPFWIGHEGGTVNNDGITTVFNGQFSDILLARFLGAGSLNYVGDGVTVLAADNSYVGDTNILEGTLRVTGTLSDTTAVSVSEGATYEVVNSDEVGSIEGAGNIEVRRHGFPW